MSMGKHGVRKQVNLSIFNFLLIIWALPMALISSESSSTCCLVRPDAPLGMYWHTFVLALPRRPLLLQPTLEAQLFWSLELSLPHWPYKQHDEAYYLSLSLFGSIQSSRLYRQGEELCCLAERFELIFRPICGIPVFRFRYSLCGSRYWIVVYVILCCFSFVNFIMTSLNHT